MVKEQKLRGRAKEAFGIEVKMSFEMHSSSTGVPGIGPGYMLV